MNPKTFLSTRIHKSDAHKILIGLIACETIFLVAYIFMYIITPNVWWGGFDFESEQSIPTWFSSVQLFIWAIVFFVIFHSTNEYRWFYALGSAMLFFLSMDEATAFHEGITKAAVGSDIKILKSVMIGGYGAWVIPYALIGLILILIMIRPIMYIYRHYTKPFLFVFFGVLIAIIGGIGLEVFSYVALREGPELNYLIEVAAEEFFEMLGVSIALYGTILIGIEVQSAAN